MFCAINFTASSLVCDLEQQRRGATWVDEVKVIKWFVRDSQASPGARTGRVGSAARNLLMFHQARSRSLSPFARAVRPTPTLDNVIPRALVLRRMCTARIGTWRI